MLTALRIVNIFPVFLRRIKTIVLLEAHEVLHWKLVDEYLADTPHTVKPPVM
jgi:hypothetical protein